MPVITFITYHIFVLLFWVKLSIFQTISTNVKEYIPSFLEIHSYKHHDQREVKIVMSRLDSDPLSEHIVTAIGVTVGKQYEHIRVQSC